jgi:uncharacterized radical SAM superfamily protein
VTLSKPATQAELHRWFVAAPSELGALFKRARQIAEAYFDRSISIYIPGDRFPAISVTGTHCQLNCQHCRGRFLEQMHAITHPSRLLSFAKTLASHGGLGCLISGGCDAQGQVPLSPFLSTLAEIKKTTSLFLNVHTGLLDVDSAQRLAETGIDCASVDVVGYEDTIRRVYGLTHHSTLDYARTLTALAGAKVPTAPHVCVGLHFGQLAGELSALKLIQSIMAPRVIVIIALMSDSFAAAPGFASPSNIDIARVCALARLMFPESEVALGCMRPRGAARREIERLAVEAGITRLVLPTQATISYLQEQRYTVHVERSCCVVPSSSSPTAKWLA